MPAPLQHIDIPVGVGLDQATSEMSAETPRAVKVTNVWYDKDGEAAPRPGFQSYNSFTQRVLSTTSGLASNNTGLELSSLGYTPLGMVEVGGTSGPEPALVANGRVWQLQSGVWYDKLFCTSASARQVASLLSYGPVQTTNGADRYPAVCDTFFSTGTGLAPSNVPGAPLLINDAIAGVHGTGVLIMGGACVTTNGADRYHVVCGNTGTNTDITVSVRKNDELTLTTSAIPTLNDCRQLSTAGAAPNVNTGDAPTVVAATNGQFYVCYKSSAAVGTYVMAKVSAVTRTVTVAKVATNIVGKQVNGLWITLDGNGDVLLAVTTTDAAFTAFDFGVGCRRHLGTTLALQAGSTVQFDGASTRRGVGPCVIGAVDTTTGRAVVGYTDTEGGVHYARYSPATAFVTPVARYYGLFTTVAEAQMFWGIPFAPCYLGGRQVAGVSVSTGVDGSPFLTGSATYTWFAVDLTDVGSLDGEDGLEWGTRRPGIIAQGPVQGSAEPRCPSSSLVVSNALYFSSLDWGSFVSRNGLNPSTVLNKVVLQAPTAATIGGETITAGSVPYSLCGGSAFEKFFLQVAPEISGSAVAVPGSLATGSYAFQACWVWTDEAGNVHRSAPSATTSVVNATFGSVSPELRIQNLQMTTRERVFIELYMAGPGASTSAVKTLYATVQQTANSGETVIQALTLAKAGTLPLYTAAGAVMQNTPVRASGGVAVVAGRAWMADGGTVYASKLSTPGNKEPVSFSDEGQLTLEVPAAAGKVVALRPLGDKLVILCDNGICMTQGDGPNNTGAGPGFIPPFMVSDIGVVAPQSTCFAADYGVAFLAKDTKGIPAATAVGGIYLVSGNGVQRLSGVEQDDLQDVDYHLTFLPERGTLFAATPAESITNNILCYDLLRKKVSLWDTPGTDYTESDQGGGAHGVVAVRGRLWLCCAAGSNLTSGVGAYEAFAGQDSRANSGVVDTVVVTDITTNHVYVGEGQLGWGRVRSAYLLGETVSGATSSTAEVTFTTTQDQTRTGTSPNFTVPSVPPGGGGGPTTWPASRPMCEYRLPAPQCSQVKLVVRVTPSVLKLNTLRLAVQKSARTAPTVNRN